MEVPQALRDVTNQSPTDESEAVNLVVGRGTPTDLSEKLAIDEHLLQIAQQCEFYFSDANILKDQFLLNKVKSSNGGWVKLEVIEGFKKMQKLATDHKMVLQALALSKKLEVSDDGLNVRRRDPLPQWDSAVYYRSLIISQLPDKSIQRESITQFFVDRGIPPLLVRTFPPGRKISSDLKRSQALHPLLGTEPSAVVEFTDRDQASKALAIVKHAFPEAYVHFLSDGAKKTADGRPKKKKEKMPPKPPTGRPAFLLNLKQPVQTSQVIHIREPIGPQSESSIGFAVGWREMIRLERMNVSITPVPSHHDICSKVNPLPLFVYPDGPPAVPTVSITRAFQPFDH